MMILLYMSLSCFYSVLFQSSIQITFDSSLQLNTTLIHVLFTQQSAASVSMETYQIHIVPVLAKVKLNRLWLKSGEICCVLNLDQPSTEKTTRFLSLPNNPNTPVEWSEDISLYVSIVYSSRRQNTVKLMRLTVGVFFCYSDLGLESKELRIRLLERNGKRESKSELIPIDFWLHGSVLPLRSSLTPTKKVDVDRTIMPDGTIVTTVTTVQSRLKLDHSDSPLRSPSKVEVTEKKPTILSDGKSSSSPNPSSNRLSNGLDPVAETAIRQLTESKVVRKTPTKRSTLIISGVSKVPLSKDDSSLSSGYAAAMDASLHGNHYGAGHSADPDETTPSDVSERPSVDDVESDTGSTGALETRSLKDHKVGFLQSGTKLLFRRKHQEKESCFSQSHEDLSNMGNNFVVSTASTHKKSGSFSRRLIKRFSFRTSSKSKSKASSANGGASSLDN
uniref:Uncharacterized protein n=1 Tax=Periophthalmus magnuspinnatus TaxID=409849 RepID=A0A3B3ZGM0_9GOBI